ncbi:hypothetical protein IFR05_001170 [Cadophora sp. M221]|nr:hypothetical protein IFR05_001170 [Cadophora sp. M221]
MTTNLASKDPPITLARREELQQHQISFHAPPHEIVFNTNAGDLMIDQQLRKVVDNILSKLAHEFPSIEGPKPGAWKLSTKDVDEDLLEWNPHRLAPGALIAINAIKSNLENYRPVITGKVAAQERSWQWAKVKVFGQPKRMTETTHGNLVPNSHTVSHMLETIRANRVSGVYQVPHEENLRHDQRSVTELGWTNGTTLRLELW